MRTLINAPKVSATLYRFADWLQGSQAPASQTVQTRAQACQIKVIPLRPSPKALAPRVAAERPPANQRPLRVLRIVDSQNRSAGGRMVISGRMVDVCAELDRMARKEAAAA
jgi:hypothetical protein